MSRSWPAPLVLAASLALACPSDDSGEGTMGTTSSTETATAAGPPVGRVSAGADVYGEYCGATACHGPDGDTGLGLPLSGGVSGYDDDALESVIVVGIPPGMPGQDFSAQELADLMAYLRSTF